MAELADAHGLGPCAERRAGSSPVPGTSCPETRLGIDENLWARKNLGRRLPTETGEIFFSLSPGKILGLGFVVAFPENLKFTFLRASGLQNLGDLEFPLWSFVLAEIGRNASH
jgi:hypothetical protein